VSVSSAGKQADGPSGEPSIDGHCSRVAFTSRATNLALTHTKVKPRRKALTRRPRRGTSQVYVHVLPWGTGIDRPWRNATYLVSADNHGRPGNGDSSEPSLATQKGRGIAFTSTSTNLAAGDRTPGRDVYVRMMIYKLTRWRTYLASANAGGHAGNGPSWNPSVAGQGLQVAYQTDATDLLPGDTNDHTDVGRADLVVHPGRPTQYWASHGERGGASTAPAFNPSISYGGQFVMFTSASGNWEGPSGERVDTNGVSDVFLWTIHRRRVFQMSADSTNRLLALPSDNGTQSAHGNYAFFETSDPLADASMVSAHYSSWLSDPGGMRAHAASNPAFSQVYERYVGPE
jgi:hypothetical protein